MQCSYCEAYYAIILLVIVNVTWLKRYIVHHTLLLVFKQPIVLLYCIVLEHNTVIIFEELLVCYCPLFSTPCLVSWMVQYSTCTGVPV